MAFVSAETTEGGAGFGKAVRLTRRHGFRAFVERVQAGDEGEIRRRARYRRLSLAGHAGAVLLALVLGGWCMGQVQASFASSPASAADLLSRIGAFLLIFMAVFGIVRLVPAAYHLGFGEDEPLAWPRRNVDWGSQKVVMDRDGIGIESPLVRRSFPWDTMAELSEDETFIIERKDGKRIVIPKEAGHADDMRDRLMRGITLSPPVSRPETL